MLQSQEKVRFGLYIADFHTFELRRGQDTIPVQNQPFRILALLLREPGRVVSREEIRQELWPADTFVDYERSISTAIGKLREALGDSASNPRFIETVGRRGYRFIAPVSILSADTEASQSVVAGRATVAIDPEPPPAPRLLKRAAFLSIAVVVIALAGLAFDWIARPASPSISKMVQLTASGRIEPAADIHTDGSRLFFAERSGPVWSLMQTSIAGGDVVPVPAPSPETILVGISPDHTQMLISRRVPFGEKPALWIMPVQGGTPHRVGDILVSSASWFPDGRRLLCSLDHEVFSIEVDGTHRRHLFDIDGVPFRFAWSPDGRSFRFSLSQQDDTRNLWEASADGSNLHPVLPGWNEPPNECCGKWSPDGRSFVFTSIKDGLENLWLLREDVGWPWHSAMKPVQLTNGPTSFSDPVFSSDGKTIFATGIQGHGYVARFDPKTHQFSRTNYAFDFVFSHDGKWMAYIAAPGNTLWRSRIDGTEKLQLTSPPVAALSPRWSPDDKKLLFMGRQKVGPHAVYTISADGGEPQIAFENNASLPRLADWSPDQQSLLIDAEPESNSRLPMTQLSLATHEATAFPGSEGLWYPRWSPRGDYLAAVSSDWKKVFLFDVQSKTWRLAATAAQVRKIDWAPDGNYLLYQDYRSPMQPVFRLQLSTGKIERVVDCSIFLREGATSCSFDARAPDGALMFSVVASYANLYALELNLH